MTRLYVLAAVVVLATGCGTSAHATNGCFHVFYLVGATRDDIRTDVETLRADRRVVGLRYISAERALKQMLRHGGSPPFDPPQASLRVRARDRQSAKRLVRTLRARPAVEGAALFPLRRKRC